MAQAELVKFYDAGLRMCRLTGGVPQAGFHKAQASRRLSNQIDARPRGLHHKYRLEMEAA
jgi:hypothetical protein